MDLKQAIDLYNSVGKRNGEFLFNWLHRVYSKVYLPCIEQKFSKNLALVKTKLTIFDVLMDDLADKREMRQRKLLKEFIHIPWQSDAGHQSNYLKAGQKVWQDCITGIRDYPRFPEFKSLFFFDLRQVMSSMEYSFLVNTKGIDNPVENGIHAHHGCMVMLHCDLDLMCSPGFDRRDLPAMRALTYLAQKVSHIGNMLNTYPRELSEQDFSSPIISLAARKGVISRDNVSEKDARKVRKLEGRFVNEAEEALKEMERYENDVESVDLAGFSKSVRQLFQKFRSRKHYWEE